MTLLIILILLIASAGLLPLGFRQLGRASMFFWLPSWLGQTFALPLALLSLVITLFLLSSYDGGMAVPLLALLATGLCLVQHLRNHRMGRELLQQLARELPLDQARRAALADYRVPLLSGLNPIRVKRPGVECLKDIPYGPHGKRNLLDIYRLAAGGGPPMPILVQIHGGAWVLGSKDSQGQPLMQHLAANGWMCVAINYRLAPGDRFPAMLNDILHAIAWVKEHAHEYGGDPGFIALTGGSAGGHLSALAALVAGREGIHSDFPAEASGIGAVLPLYGRYDFLDRHGVWGEGAAKLTEFKATKIMPGPPDEHLAMWQLASPVEQVYAGAPPFLLVHGTQDSLIDVREAHHFADALRGVAGPEMIFAELRGAEHAFEMLQTPLTQYFTRAAQCFLEYQLARRQSPEAVTAGVTGEAPGSGR